MNAPKRVLCVAIVGYGKIAQDQHVPSIAGSPDLELVAYVSRRRSAPDGVPAFADIDELLRSGIPVDAVALCNTPGNRPGTALQAIAAGLYVFMEKPLAASLGPIAAIERSAADAGVTLFASWHSRCASGVGAARDCLRDKTIRSVVIDRVEDVRRWHPGQPWTWLPGGFGVFNPGINALSVATEILPFEPIVSKAELRIPSNRQTPIAVELAFERTEAAESVSAHFDWDVVSGDRHAITVVTDSGTLELTDGGACLHIDGWPVEQHGRGEYPGLYERFVRLVGEGRSDVDVRPLRLVADAFMLGGRVPVAPFEEADAR